MQVLIDKYADNNDYCVKYYVYLFANITLLKFVINYIILFDMKSLLLIISVLFINIQVFGQNKTIKSKLRQLGTELPSPNNCRTSAGAPGKKYWQQKADYAIEVTLDDEKQQIRGTEIITYHNNSPDVLNYLWIQLEQNFRKPDSDSYKIEHNKITGGTNKWTMRNLHYNFQGGLKIDYVKDKNGKNLPYVINNTMMRVDLPHPLKSKSTYTLKLKWSYNISSRYQHGGRSGLEFFERDSNYLYFIAQFHPRMAVYSDIDGWNNKQFLGYGEFTLEFGDFDVKITVPKDHIVAATGELKNSSSILTSQQITRLKEAKTANKPILIVTPEEALKNENEKAKTTKTWHFVAKNVRDFAFASSRKFIWDAKGVDIGGKKVMSMAFYPNEANPLWGQFANRIIEHTIISYSEFTFDYPYPVVQAVHAANMGMEYPMICFCGARPDANGTYSEQVKNRLINVIIHEVGHNWFPMIVNSDERQWTWMDEGLNCFLQFYAEKSWDRDFPSARGPANTAVEYMVSPQAKQRPIMTNSECIPSFFSNAYGKASIGLNILRETIMGHELFDYAFKTYANRWKFKHPSPADFFRTMEDASAVDLDWFWRGWFYTTDHVDISIDNVKVYRLNTHDPETEYKNTIRNKKVRALSLAEIRIQEDSSKTYMENHPEAKDFYSKYNYDGIYYKDKKAYKEFYNSLPDEAKHYYDKTDNLYYEIDFRNIGGLVMPIILKFDYEDGTSEIRRIPVEIWRYDNINTTKTFPVNKKVKRIVLDPFLETADTNTYNNIWSDNPEIDIFELYDY